MTAADALRRVLDRAEMDGWTGSDPYDALLSPIGRAVIPFGPLPRFVLSQVVLRIPFARTLVKPPGSVNTKALALFLGAVTRGRNLLGVSRPRALAEELVGEIERRGTRAGEGLGWGYPFPWQSRSFWAPAGTPNAVVTATVGWHALDYAGAFKDDTAHALGIGAARFLASGLRLTPQEPDGAALSYTALDGTRVVNISALASRLLLRAATLTGESHLAATGAKLLRFVLRAQRPDGTWPYSADRGGTWMDSFHTGYVLEALLSVREFGTVVPDDALARGFEAYARFFNADGGARLHAVPSSPLDAHSAAQGVITYDALHSSSVRSIPAWGESREKALRIAFWAREALWVPSKGYFAYRIQGGRRDEREFTRWVQAWMALAMATAENTERTAVPDLAADAVGVA